MLSGALWIALLLGFALFGALLRRRRPERNETWGCGYAAPTPRMQYTARSFSDLGQSFLPRSLRPRVTRSRPDQPFPAPVQLSTDCRDPFTRAAYEPFLDRWARRFARLRWVQQGLLHLYVLYILVTVIVALTVVAIEARWGLP